jgi:hypothetical protein
MNKNWYLVAAILGVFGTIGVAMQHALGWTILGVLSVWCNIYNYTSGDKKEGE